MFEPVIKAAIFDFDDTLVDSEDFFCKHLNNTLLKLYGRNYDKNIIETARLSYRNNLPFENIFRETFRENYHVVLKCYQRDASDFPYKARTGMLDFVRELQDQNTSLYILSNRSRFIQFRLKQSGYNPDHFKIHKAIENKPHQSAYSKVLLDIKNSGIKKSEIIFIGNHPDDYLAIPDENKIKSTFIALPTNEEAERKFLSLSKQCVHGIIILKEITELRIDDGRICKSKSLFKS